MFPVLTPLSNQTNQSALVMEQGKHQCQFQPTFPVPKLKPNPGPWTLLKRQLRLLTTVSVLHPQAKSLFRSSHARYEERVRHASAGLWLSIHPYSVFNYGWQVLMSLVYVLNVVSDLAEATFPVDHQWLTKYMLLLHVLTALDVAFNFITGYIENVDKHIITTFGYSLCRGEKHVQLKPEKIARTYVKSFFFIDCIVFMNIIILFLPANKFSIRISYYVIGIRMLRHARFITVFKNVQHLICRETLNAYRLFYLIFLYFYGKYVLTCLNILVPDMIMFFEGAPRVCLVSVLQDKYKLIGRALSAGAMYAHSDYQSTFCILGFFDMPPQQLAVESRMLYFAMRTAGVILAAFVFALVMRVSDSSYKAQLKFLRFLANVRHYSRQQDCDEDTARLLDTCMQDHLKTVFFDEKEILDTLQCSMEFEVFTQSSMDLITKCKLFNKLPSEYIGKIAKRLKLETYPPGMKLVRHGELASCMYFIRSGTVAVVSPRGHELCHLSDGDYFGEVGLMHELASHRIADVWTVEYCELYRLDARDYQQVVKPSSVFYHRLQERSRRRVIQNRRSSSSSWQRSDDDDVSLSSTAESTDHPSDVTIAPTTRD